MTIPNVCRRHPSGGRGISPSMCWRGADTSNPLEIQRIVRHPERRQVQVDGRIRIWGYAASGGGYLRVVLFADGETVHNAFYDEDYRP